MLSLRLYLPTMSTIDLELQEDQMNVQSAILKSLESNAVPATTPAGRRCLYKIYSRAQRRYLDEQEVLNDANLFLEEQADYVIVSVIPVFLELPDGSVYNLIVESDLSAQDLLIEAFEQMKLTPITQDGDAFYPMLYSTALGRVLQEEERLDNVDIPPFDKLLIQNATPVADEYIDIHLRGFVWGNPDQEPKPELDTTILKDVPIKFLIPKLVVLMGLPLYAAIMRWYGTYTLVLGDDEANFANYLDRDKKLEDYSLEDGTRITLIIEGAGGGGRITPAVIINKQPQKLSEEPAHFTLFYPKQVLPNQQNEMVFYIHTVEKINDIRADFAQYTKQSPSQQAYLPRMTKDPVTIKRFAPLTITPEADNVDFNPVSITLRWEEDIEKVAFRFNVSERHEGEIILGRIAVSIGMVEIGSISFALDVQSGNIFDLQSSHVAEETSQNYRAIFVSYSREDTEIMFQVTRAYKVMGDSVFIDVESIRSGEDPDAAIEQGINTADIFQLYCL